MPFTGEYHLRLYDKVSILLPERKCGNLTSHIGTNQAVNFTAYTEFKRILHKWQPQYHDALLPSWQTTIIGLVSGAMGPLSNAPIDTIKTRLQTMPRKPGESAWSRIVEITRGMFRSVIAL